MTPVTDPLVQSLLDALDHVADLERALREAAEKLAGWQVVAKAACAALDAEIRQSRSLREEGQCSRRREDLAGGPTESLLERRAGQ